MSLPAFYDLMWATFTILLGLWWIVSAIDRGTKATERTQKTLQEIKELLEGKEKRGKL